MTIKEIAVASNWIASPEDLAIFLMEFDTTLKETYGELTADTEIEETEAMALVEAIAL